MPPYWTRTVKIGDRFLHAGDSGAEVGAFEAAGDGDHQLEVFAEDFVLRGELLDVGEGAEGGHFAGGAEEDGVLDGVEGGAVGVVEADADGVGAAVLDKGLRSGQAVEDGGGVGGDFGGGETQASGEAGVDLEGGGGTADGVVDAVLDVDHAGDFADGIADARGELVEEVLVGGEELDLDGFGGVGEVADHVLEDLSELDVEFGLGSFDALAGVFHDVVDGAAAMVREQDSEVAGVGFCDSGQSHLQAGAARGGGDLRKLVEDAVDVEEDAVGLLQRRACGHDVVEDEGALVHFGEQVGAESSISNEHSDN